MAARCLDARLETLRPLCCPHPPSPVGTLQAVQTVVMLSARHVLQKQPTVYCAGVWGLHCPRTNSRRWWRPEGFSAATPESSWRCGQELSPTGRPLKSTWRDSSPKQPSLPSVDDMKVVTELTAGQGTAMCVAGYVRTFQRVCCRRLVTLKLRHQVPLKHQHTFLLLHSSAVRKTVADSNWSDTEVSGSHSGTIFTVFMEAQII